MLLLRVTDSRGAVTQHVAESFPYKIGRSPQASLRLEAPGVWECHATILPGENARFLIRAEGDSLLLQNGEPIRTAPLATGDELSFGSAKILVSLAPATQKSIVLSEAVVWVLLLGVIALEIVIFVVAG
jgi:hypothetical protein